MNKLVSIITPFYNAEQYLAETISSVIHQEYQNWELLLIKDGSTDQSGDIAQSYSDPRIKYFEQDNYGVSAARNLGLKNMTGSFFCFLDADDIMPKGSLASRLVVFDEDENIDFVDGSVTYVDNHLRPINKLYNPKFKGYPLNRLLRLDRSCLFGNTWMIRRHDEVQYHFNESLSHAEDLYFYLSVCVQKEGLYAHTTKEVLHYRQSNNSAMRDLNGLENGYFLLLSNITDNKIASFSQLVFLRLKVAKIMFLSHLFDGKDIKSAFRSLIRLIIS